MKVHSLVGLGVALMLVLAVPGRAAAVDITGCGQTVPAKGKGILTTDLVCSNSASAVFVGERAKLTFGGHSITGGGVVCEGTCKLSGPGTIQQVMPATQFGNAAAVLAGSGDGKARFDAKGLTITGSFFGIVSNSFKVQLRDVDASGNVHHGVWIVVGHLRGKAVTTNDNGETGVKSEQGKVKLVRLTATNNGQAGLINNGTATALVRSTLTGNHFGPFPGNPTELDLASFTLPRVIKTTCEHSLGPDGTPWGVCSGD